MPEQKTKEDLDRELIELLNELRVALPGVQVLFAFLLAVPFTSRFRDVTDLQKNTFVVALLCTAIGSAFLIAPSAYHRLRWREHDKERMLRISNREAIVGTIFLAVAMTTSVFLVLDLLFKVTLTALLTAVVAGVFLWLWYALPLWRRARDARSGR